MKMTNIIAAAVAVARMGRLTEVYPIF